MPVPNASLTPDETVQWSPSGPTALALTTSGALRVQRPRGPLVQAGTVNLVINPVPAPTPSGWGGGVSATTTIVNRPWDSSKLTRKRVSTASTQIGLGPIATTAPTTIAAVVAGTTYTFSATVMTEGQSGNVSLLLYGRNASGVDSEIAGVSSVVWHDRALTTNVPKRVAASFTIPTGVASIANLGIWFPWSAAGQAAYMCDMQLEIGDHPTDFVDPDDPDTYWIAAANNSPSVRPDRYSQLWWGWFVEEATVNYDPNPISASTTHLANNYAHITPTRITNAGLNHPTAGIINTATRITITSTPAENNVVGIWAASGLDFSVGAVVTHQVYFRVSPKLIGKQIGVILAKIGGTYEQVVKTVIGTGDWQYVDATLIIGIAGGSSIFMYIRPSSVDTITGDANMVGEYIDFTATQIEQKSYATSLAVHTMGTGYSLGAANVTNRAYGEISVPAALMAALTERGALYIRYLPRRAFATSGTKRLVRSGTYSGTNASFAIKEGQFPVAEWYNGSGTTAVAAIDAAVDGQIASVYTGWDGTDFHISVNDGPRNHVVRPIPPNPTVQPLSIGGYSGTQMANVYVFAVIAFLRPPTDGELAALNAIPTEELSYASIVGIGPQLGGLLLTHPGPGFAVLRTHGGS